MFETTNTKEMPRSPEEVAAERYRLALAEIFEMASNNESEKAINLKMEGIFQQVAKDLEDIKKRGEGAGNTWPRQGDDFGGMNPDRFKPHQ
jgi:DNA polymerase/3'-5' exonuclease PolX